MPTIDPQKDYYAVLGILGDADEEQVKKAYRDKARQYHPDSADGGNAALFRDVQEAYEVLRDLSLRRSYDRQREKRGFSDSAPIALELLQNMRALPVLTTPQMLYVLLDIRAKKDLAETRQRLNLALVIDRSTSMKGARMQNVKMAATDLLNALHPDDRLAIVAFSDRAEVLAPSDYVRNTNFFHSAIAAMTPGGGTEIYQGLLSGLRQVQNSTANNTVNHVILLTDGRTYGDEDFALSEARRAGAQNIGISALGIGEDWNDVFLDKLALYGGGISRYIHSPAEVRDVLQNEIRGLSNILAQRMQVEAILAQGVTIKNVHRAMPYMESLEYQAGQPISLGNLTVNDPVSIMLEIVVEEQSAGDHRLVRFELQADEVPTSAKVRLYQELRVEFSLAPKEEPISPRMLNILMRLNVFQLQERAWAALEGGNSKQATRYLEAAATKLFDMGYKELGQAAMSEVGRISQGGEPTGTGRKRLRYGTRALSMPLG